MAMALSKGVIIVVVNAPNSAVNMDESIVPIELITTALNWFPKLSINGGNTRLSFVVSQRKSAEALPGISVTTPGPRDLSRSTSSHCLQIGC